MSAFEDLTNSPSHCSGIHPFSEAYREAVRDLSAYAISPPRVESSLPSIFGRFARRVAIATAAVSGIGATVPETASAALANLPEHVAIVGAFAEQARRDVEPALDTPVPGEHALVEPRYWNNLNAALTVADSTTIESLNEIRSEIVRSGRANPSVPALTVHTAMYSAVEHVRALEAQNDQVGAQADKIMQRCDALGDEFARLAIPYLGKVIVDTETNQGHRERHLVPRSQVEALVKAADKAEVYDQPRFDELAAYVIGNLGSEALLREVLSELELPSNDQERRSALLDVFMHAAKRHEIKPFLSSLESFIFDSSVPTSSCVEGIASDTNYEDPRKASAAILARIEKIDPIPVSLKMSDPFKRSAVEQQFIAKSISALSQQESSKALAACAQWFAYKAQENITSDPLADHIVLEALAQATKRDPFGMKVLKRVGSSHPEIFFTSMLKSVNSPKDNELNRAGTGDIVNCCG